MFINRDKALARLQVSDIQDNDHYRLLNTLDHQNLASFLLAYYFQKRSWLSWLHYSITICSLIFWIVIPVLNKVSLWKWFEALFISLLGFILLIPVHEAIHAFVYWLLGARDIRFSVSFSQSYVYAIANRFVVSQVEFIGLAIAPFLLLNGSLIILAIIFPRWQLLVAGLFVLHTTATSGDWALLNYYWENRKKNLLSYDDAQNQVTYFYEPQG